MLACQHCVDLAAAYHLLQNLVSSNRVGCRQPQDPLDRPRSIFRECSEEILALRVTGISVVRRRGAVEVFPVDECFTECFIDQPSPQLQSPVQLLPRFQAFLNGVSRIQNSIELALATYLVLAIPTLPFSP